MKISDLTSIEKIQEEFNQQFPYLKIEFYKEKHRKGEGSPDAIKWSNEKTIGEIRKEHTKGELTIIPTQKVSALENNFLEQYGLNVQVFSRSGDLWLQTTTTDDWTLEKQNDHAASFAAFQKNNV